MKFETRGSGAPETAELPEEVSGEGKKNLTGKQKPVFLYLVILFAIAFLLILFSFVMQHRSNAELLRQLQSQADILQELRQIEEKYDNALAEIASLKETVDGLTEENEDIRAQADQHFRAETALTLLWQLNDGYEQGAGEDVCRPLLQQLQEDKLYEALPDTAAAGEESPRAAYDRIARAMAE